MGPFWILVLVGQHKQSSIPSLKKLMVVDE